MTSLAEIIAMTLPAVLELDLLRTFALIAESGSFTLAAERVGRSQSAVSLQVQRLESLVGHRLFLRGKGKIVRLTPKGRDLLGPARDLLLLNDETVRALRAGQLKADGDLHEAGPATLEGPLAVGRSGNMPSIAVLPFQTDSNQAHPRHRDKLLQHPLAPGSRECAAVYFCRSLTALRWQ